MSKSKTGKTPKIILDYKTVFSTIKNLKYYLYFVVAAFVLTIILGLLYPSAFPMLEEYLIKYIQENTVGKGFLEITLFIIWNNTKAALFVMAFGIILGIMPFIALLTNGYVIGSFVRTAIAETQNPYVFLKLLPHSIFEIPAFLLAIALGLKIGITAIRVPKNLKKLYLQAGLVFICLVLPLLIIAGLIEGILVVFFK